MSGSVAADFVPHRHGQAQTVQTPVQTSRGKYPYLQVGSNPVCAFLRTARTYTHVVADECELDYAQILACELLTSAVRCAGEMSGRP